MVGTPSGAKPSELAARAVALADRYSRELTEFTRTFLGANGIANRDVQLLLTIDRKPGIRPSALAEQIGISRALVSQALRRFDSVNLVGRSTDSTDRRSRGLRMTPSGHAMIRSYEGELSRWFAEEGPLVEQLHTLLHHPISSSTSPDPAPLEVIGKLAAVGAAYGSELRPLLQPFGHVTVTQRRLLTLLDAFGPQRPVQLASRLSLTTGGISIALDALEDAALISRRLATPDTDRKAVQVSLTVRGGEAAAVTRGVFTRHSDEILDVLALTTRVRRPGREAEVATSTAS
ncbi:MAG: MarR family transcriptional regulator [Propionibacteriales bacterium]|nr:MarR family transcriptional regulator [Propionibacteriales bacterium]